MATIRRDIHLRSDPATVWEAVRDVGAAHLRLAPGVLTETEFDGHARLVTFAGGWQVRELIVDVDDDQQRLAYAVVDGVFTHHHASMEVVADGDGRSRLVWTTDLLPHDAAPTVEGARRSGVTAMRVFAIEGPHPGASGAARRLGRAMSDVITISLPDGAAREFPAGTTAGDVAASIGRRLAKAAVAATVARDGGDKTEIDLGRPLHDGDRVAIVTDDSEAGRHVLRHSTAHVMAQAVTQLFPGSQVLDRPGHRERLLLRLRPARMVARSTRTTSWRSTPGCARSSLPTSRSCAPR